MALANLTINLTANSAPAKAGLEEVRVAARGSMSDSQAAVEDFRAKLLRAADDMRAAALSMSSGFEAANDAMVRDTQRTAEAVDALVNKTANVKLDSMQEKVAAAFGAAASAGYAAAQTWIDKTEEYVKAKATTIGIGVAIAVVSATAAAVYTAYKVISGTYDFIKGLFTGESYKSDNIDALIAVNKEVKDLQDRLFVSAQYASALNDALARLGVDKGDFVAVQEAAEKAQRTNGDELDRLGVKYKDANGQLLETTEFLKNVKTALEEYTEGYDRNAAAAAMGVGSYKQVVAYLKVTQEEVAKSKDRLEEYGLVIGPQTQAYIEQYQRAVREFQHETELTSQGIKRAIADNVMPILTTLADFFKEGFPTAVRAFRYTLAQVTSMFYGWKSVIDIVWDTWSGLWDSMKTGVVAIGTALMRAATGDFAGAWKAITDGWDQARTRMGKTWDDIVADMRKNAAAMAQAWGMPDSGPGLPGRQRDGTKSWTPKPADTPKVEVKSPYQNFLDELDRMVKKVQENEYAMLRLKAAQLQAKEPAADLLAAYRKINELQRGDSQKVVDEYTRRLKEESDSIEFQISLIGQQAHEVERLTFARQKKLEVDRLIEQAERSGRPLDITAVADLRQQADEAIRRRNSAADRGRIISRDMDTGYKQALQEYVDSATNMAEQVKAAMTNGLRGIEDAFVKMAMTGKLSFRDLANSVIADMIRIQVRQNITAPLASALSGFNLKGLLGFADGGDPPLGVPSWVGENGPELFVPRQAGTVIPNGALGGGGVTVNQPLTIYAPNASAETVGQIRALMPGFIAENKRVVLGVVQQAIAQRGGRFAS